MFARQPFQMTIDDVFFIRGRGLVVSGRVAWGVVSVGDAVEVQGLNGVKRSSVAGIEMLARSLQQAQTGENIGLLLSGLAKDDVKRGDTIVGAGAP